MEANQLKKKKELTNAAKAWSNYIPDGLLCVLYFAFLKDVMHWQSQHLVLSMRLVMLLNIIVVLWGCISFFSTYGNKEYRAYANKSIPPFQRKLVGVSTFICALGFSWWFIPFNALKSIGITSILNIVGVVVYLFSFLAIIPPAIQNKKYGRLASNKWATYFSNTLTAFFFFFSYAFLLVSIQLWGAKSINVLYLGLFCMVVFYLPLRIFLLLKPPFSRFEYISFMLSFGLLLYDLFGKL